MQTLLIYSQQKGLDSYNKGLIDEVKSIAHQCLTEQFEEIPKEKVNKKGSRKRKQKDHLSMEYELKTVELTEANPDFAPDNYMIYGW